METQVIADLIPLIPDFLKKVPWQVRIALIASFFIFSGYAVIAQWAGWTLFPHATLYWGLLGVIAGAPAGANVTVKKGNTVGAVTDLEGLGKALSKAIASAPTPVIHVYADMENIADRIKSILQKDGPLIDTVGAQAVQVVDEVDPAAAPEVAKVETTLEELNDAVDPSSSPLPTPSADSSPPPESPSSALPASDTASNLPSSIDSSQPSSGLVETPAASSPSSEVAPGDAPAIG